jgi:holo-[acyl-carrier protein] synthase
MAVSTAPVPLRVGVDLVEVARVKNLIDKYGARFIRRIFTPREQAACGRQSARWQVERLAARFAAKEAVAKALGTGIGAVAFCEIEVVNDDLGRPELVLYGGAAELGRELGLQHWAISLSHTREQAVAFVTALGP